MTTAFAIDPQALKATLEGALGALAKRVDLRLGEVTVTVAAADYLKAAQVLRDAPGCQFEQLIDLAGLDYSEYKNGTWDGPRYGVVSHLLSVSLNQRVRLKVFCPDDDLPVVDSVTGLWSAANWFERGLRPVRHRLRGPRGPAPHPDRLRLHRPPVPQGLPGVRPRRDALRPRAPARDLPAGDDRAARDHAADHPRRQLRGPVSKSWLKSRTTP